MDISGIIYLSFLGVIFGIPVLIMAFWIVATFIKVVWDAGRNIFENY